MKKKYIAKHTKNASVSSTSDRGKAAGFMMGLVGGLRYGDGIDMVDSSRFPLDPCPNVSNGIAHTAPLNLGDNDTTGIGMVQHLLF